MSEITLEATSVLAAIAPGEGALQPAETPIAGPGSAIFVVDDDADCREVPARFLRGAGYQVRTAATAREAAAAAADPAIGLLITDLWMPEGNGMHLLGELARTRPDLEVTVFTGHATATTRQAAREAGCLQVVDKPDVTALLATVRTNLGGDRELRLAAEGRLPEKSRLGRVLLADDHPEVIAVVSRLMDRRGYDMVTARDGAEALERFTPGAFDLVLMDINMPRMDGVEATRKIHRWDPAASIMLLSGEAGPDQVRAAMSAGAMALVSKPVDFDRLTRQVRHCIAETRRRRWLAQRDQRHSQRTFSEKARSFCSSRRQARSRRRVTAWGLWLLLAVAGTFGTMAAVDGTCYAGRMAASLIADFRGRLDYFEGYLQRDEQRELEAMADRQRATAAFSSGMDRWDDSLQREEQNRNAAAGDSSGILGRVEGYLRRDEQRKIYATGSDAPPNPGTGL